MIRLSRYTLMPRGSYVASYTVPACIKNYHDSSLALRVSIYFGNKSNILPNLPVGTRKTAYPRDVSLFLCFLKVSRQIFSLDTFCRQADEYITRSYVFYVFMYGGVQPKCFGQIRVDT